MGSPKRPTKTWAAVATALVKAGAEPKAAVKKLWMEEAPRRLPSAMPRTATATGPPVPAFARAVPLAARKELRIEKAVISAMQRGMIVTMSLMGIIQTRDAESKPVRVNEREAQKMQTWDVTATVSPKRAMKAAPKRGALPGAGSPPAREMCRLSREARAAAEKARIDVA